MNSIHSEFHTLIQFALDGVLSTADQQRLDIHLETCKECQIYAKQNKNLELFLQTAMNRKWQRAYIPLKIDELISHAQPQRMKYMPQIAVMVTLLFLVVIGTWNLAGMGPSTPVPDISVKTVPNPTPSIQATFTLISEDCTDSKYIVQPGDSLESIANKFSVSVPALMERNKILGKTLETGTELIIPTSCHKGTKSTESPTFTELPILLSTVITP